MLLLIKGDAVDRAPSLARDHGWEIAEQRTKKLTAYPAHTGTLLSRRRRGSMSVATALWFSNGWTKVQGTTGWALSCDEQQIAKIAKDLDALTIGVHYEHRNGNIGMIQASSKGTIVHYTYFTADDANFVTRPNGSIRVRYKYKPEIFEDFCGKTWDPTLVGDPTPKGLTKALKTTGFSIRDHLLTQAQMLAVVTIYK